MKILRRFFICAAIAGLLLPAGFAQSDTNTAKAPPAETDIPAVGRLPETDDGLPGTGPIRRADWFRKIWRTRRVAFSHRVDQDQGAVVFLGDSITQGWGDNLGNSFPGLKVANRGISGDTTRGALIRMKEDVLAVHPRAVVLLIGTNDLEDQADPDTVAGNMKLILAALEADNPKMPIILCEVFPSSASKKRPKENIQRVNQLYAGLVKGDQQVTLLDTWTLFADENGDAPVAEFPDLLHPNKAGYQKWAGVLQPVLAPIAAH